MGRRNSLLLLIGGTALVCGAVLALGRHSSVGGRVGGVALLGFAVWALVVWTRQSRLMAIDRLEAPDAEGPVDGAVGGENGGPGAGPAGSAGPDVDPHR
jgi:hypothetical protein